MLRPQLDSVAIICLKSSKNVSYCGPKFLFFVVSLLICPAAVGSKCDPEEHVFILFFAEPLIIVSSERAIHLR